MRSLTRHSLFRQLFDSPYHPTPASGSLLSFHTSSCKNANILPVTATGPPPPAPIPSASQYGEQANRRRRQAELLKRGQEARASLTKPGTAMKKRFWKDVLVKTEAGGFDTSRMGNSGLFYCGEMGIDLFSSKRGHTISTSTHDLFATQAANYR